MHKKSQYSININSLFRQCLHDTREMRQDTIFHSRIQKNNNTKYKRILFEQSMHSHYFSNKKKQYLLQENPISYIRDKNMQNILKNLKKGTYQPDIYLDLHGLTQFQAQQELAQLMFTCQKEKISCAHIMHGHGKNILKKHIPFWLSQHPDIIAFHQAPKIFGSDAAIIVIIEIYF